MDEKDEQQEKPGWSFRNEGELPAADQSFDAPLNDMEPISWTASEFVSRQKDIGWYLMLAGATIVVSGLAYWITKGDLISVISIAIVGAAFGFLAGKNPRELSYGVDSRGVIVGQKLYPYSQFKSFTVIREGSLSGINLWPLQRLMPEISIYCPPEQEETIIDFLSEHLPHEQRTEHIVDRLMKRIRF